MGQYDNVIDEATRSADDDSEVLDRLVPPPRPWSTRALLWIAFVTVVVLGVRSVTTGTITPRIGHSWVTHLGGTGPVFVGFETTNRSRVDIEIVGGPRARPGLVLRGYAVGLPPLASPIDEAAAVADPFPIRVRPGEAVALTVWFDVTDCAAITDAASDDREIDLQVRIAEGPFSTFTATRGISTDQLALRSTETRAPESAWPAAVAQHVCPRSN